MPAGQTVGGVVVSPPTGYAKAMVPLKVNAFSEVAKSSYPRQFHGCWTARSTALASGTTYVAACPGRPPAPCPTRPPHLAPPARPRPAPTSRPAARPAFVWLGEWKRLASTLEYALGYFNPVVVAELCLPYAGEVAVCAFYPMVFADEVWGSVMYPSMGQCLLQPPMNISGAEDLREQAVALLCHGLDICDVTDATSDSDLDSTSVSSLSDTTGAPADSAGATRGPPKRAPTRGNERPALFIQGQAPWGAHKEPTATKAPKRPKRKRSQLAARTPSRRFLQRGGSLGHAVPVNVDSETRPPLGLDGACNGGHAAAKKRVVGVATSDSTCPTLGAHCVKKVRPKTIAALVSKGPSSDGPRWKFAPRNTDPRGPICL